MGEKKYDKRIMTAVRLVLLAVGFLLGASFAGVFFSYNPDIVRDSLKIVFISSCGLLLGVALLLSARPFVALLLFLAGKLKNFFAGKKPVEVVGYVLGIALGLMVTFLVYVLLSQFLFIKPLNILITVIVAFVCCIAGAVVCSKWLLTQQDEEDEISDDGYDGYLITADAFYSPKAEHFIGEWLSGNVYVLTASVELLVSRIEEQSAVDALKTYKTLKESSKIKTVTYAKADSEREDIVKYAALKRLIIITADEDERKLYENAGKCLCLSAL